MRLQGRGEILISLCYQPAANRLTVVILKARNLPKMDLTGLCGEFNDHFYVIIKSNANLRSNALLVPISVTHIKSD